MTIDRNMMFHVEQVGFNANKNFYENKIYEIRLKLLINDSKCAIIYIKNRAERKKITSKGDNT